MKSSQQGFKVFANFIAAISFATFGLGVLAVIFRDRLVKIPGIFAILVFLIISIGVLTGIITYFYYSDSRKKTKKKNHYKRNMKKLKEGEFAEVIPQKYIYEVSKSELHDFLLEKARFFAVLQENCIKCIMIYQTKNGEIKSAKQKNFDPEEFFDYFKVSKINSPDSMLELQARLQ